MASVHSGDSAMPEFIHGFEPLQWDNASVKFLPVKDGIPQPSQVSDAVYARVNPTPLLNPKLVAISPDALTLLGLDQNQIAEVDLSQVFSGNRLLPGCDPVAHCYCGHQFGVFAGQLGDGAAIMLGEVKSPSSAASSSSRWTLQLKGSGLTPFSRTADGRKVLRSSIREFLCSEHMDALQIPTTRAGCVVTSDSRVTRDIFYSGDPIRERCSVILRIAKTFLRFGSFEIFKLRDSESGRAGPSVGNHHLLIGLANFTVFTLYPHLITSEMSHELYLWNAGRGQSPTKLPVKIYRQWFGEVVERTAKLVALWQSVGFCHGVLNTDNMSIIGDTIDYGPFGFMELFDPHYICNASDNSGRYTYCQQPSICRWNCYKLYEALNPLLSYSEEEIEEVLVNHYDKVYERTYMEKMRAKLGLLNTRDDNDKKLIEDLFDTMRMTAADFTTTFKMIEAVTLKANSHELDSASVSAVIDQILNSLGTKEDLEKISGVAGVGGWERLNDIVDSFTNNPLPQLLRVILGMTDNTLDMYKDKAKFGKQIDRVLSGDKCKSDNDRQLWSAWLHRYAERLVIDAKSDSDIPTFNSRRKELMSKSNPTVILRNHIAQKGIDAAEKGDYSEVRRLVDVLRRPFDQYHQLEDTQRGTKPLIVT